MATTLSGLKFAAPNSNKANFKYSSSTSIHYAQINSGTYDTATGKLTINLTVGKNGSGYSLNGFYVSLNHDITSLNGKDYRQSGVTAVAPGSGEYYMFCHTNNGSRTVYNGYTTYLSGLNTDYSGYYTNNNTWSFNVSADNVSLSDLNNGNVRIYVQMIIDSPWKGVGHNRWYNPSGYTTVSQNYMSRYMDTTITLGAVVNPHVTIYVRNQNADGSWGSYWTAKDEDVTYGSSYSYSAYSSDTVYQPISWSSSSVTSNQTIYLDAYRKTYTFGVYPSGGSYNGSTSYQSFSGRYGTTIGVGLATPPSGYKFAGYHANGPLTGVSSSDSIFESGNGDIGVYNNSQNGTVTHTRERDDTVPSKGKGDSNTGYRIKITKVSGTASPGCGGFYLGTNSKAGHVFRCMTWAKIPVGYTVNDHRNSIGDGGYSEWLTSRQGTGDWFLYVYDVHCGSSGSFSTFGHLALSANNGDDTAAVTWYVCAVQITDITSGALVYNYTQNGYVEAFYAPNEYTVSYNANGGSGAPSSQQKIHDVNLTLSSTRPTHGNTTATGYTVSFNGNGGTAGTATLTATDTISYSFSNWKATNGTTYNPGGTYSANAATTMTAQWSTSTTRGSITLPSASRTYYTFNGWSKVAGTSPYYNAGTSYQVTSAHTLYANWTPNAPINLSLTRSSSTTNSIVLTYSDAGVVTTRTAYYRKVGASSYTSMAITSNPFTISGLESDVNYEIYYIASNSAASSSTTVQQFSTLLTTPTITSYGTSSITPFTATVYLNGSISPSRTLQYRFSSDNGSTWTNWQNSGSYTHTGLNEETQYILGFQVKAIHTGINANDTTSNIITMTITTPADQAQIYGKNNNTWKHGKVWAKQNGEWVKAKKIYTKVNGTWVINKNN